MSSRERLHITQEEMFELPLCDYSVTTDGGIHYKIVPRLEESSRFKNLFGVCPHSSCAKILDHDGVCNLQIEEYYNNCSCLLERRINSEYNDETGVWTSECQDCETKYLAVWSDEFNEWVEVKDIG